MLERLHIGKKPYPVETRNKAKVGKKHSLLRVLSILGVPTVKGV